MFFWCVKVLCAFPFWIYILLLYYFLLDEIETHVLRCCWACVSIVFYFTLILYFICVYLVYLVFLKLTILFYPIKTKYIINISISVILLICVGLCCVPSLCSYVSNRVCSLFHHMFLLVFYSICKLRVGNTHVLLLL